ncbi:hypothetical protein C8R45DRAFT_1212042, partial [Mycena sanguinolenta]
MQTPECDRCLASQDFQSVSTSQFRLPFAMFNIQLRLHTAFFVLFLLRLLCRSFQYAQLGHLALPDRRSLLVFPYRYPDSSLGANGTFTIQASKFQLLTD